ncbi:T9SS type A sorting domain-containing protein, partial [Flavobacterium sp. DG1-102-2]|uniref:T9SS type A sorting domain-containing protein n=1 Tax=Flavobacterium sp. DG1-102-2 TaxID=3081663 RepID=UPI0029492E14
TGSAAIAVNGGTAPYSYLWNTGATTSTITNLIAGTYSVTATDANGCILSNSYTITQPVAPLALTPNTSQVDVFCFGNATGSAAIAVNGGTAPYSYLWNTGATTSTITNLIAGTYSVTVTDANGCTLSNSYTITQPAAPLALTPNTTQVNVLCFGNATGSATIAVNGGTSPYTYLWSTGATTNSITGLAAGIYTVVVTDAHGCTLSNSYTITQPSQALALTPNTTHTNVSCFGGNNGSATVAINGGTAPYTYLWNTGAATASITNLIAGTYTVDVTDANGCTLSNSFIITEPTALVASAGTQNNITCFGAANGSATVNVTGGTGTYTYSWNTTPVQTTATAGNLAPGTYIVTVKDANLCETTQSFTITQPDALTAAVDSFTNVLCYNAANGTATVSVTGGTPDYTYSWNTNPVQTTATAVYLAPGSHTVTVTDANGCHITASVTITQPAAPLHLTTSQTNVTCYGSFDGSLGVNLTGGTGPYTYTWTPAVSTTNSATGLGVGNYKVVVTDANGCSDLRYLSVTSPSLLTGTIAVTNVGCGGAQNGSAVANITGGTAPYQYLWSNGATTAAIENLAGGMYSVTVTDAHNCTFTTSTTITEPATIVITSQPQDASVEAGQWVVFSVTVQNATKYQWQVSTNGGTTWANVPNGGASPHYSGGTTAQFSIANITMGLNGNLYRVIVSQNGNCPVVSDDANLTVTAPVAAIEDVRKLSMTVYPNPASTNVYIRIPDFEYFENLKVAVYDLNGRVIRNEQAITSDNYHIDVTGLESAVYIITITSDTGRIDKKIVVNKTL